MAPNLALAGNNLNFSLRRDLQRGNNSAGNSTVSSSGSSDSNSSFSNSSKNSSIQKYLINCKSIYSCIYCRTHLANHDELVSRSFQGNHGRAYLFNSVVNISCGPAVQRELNTGSHAVADIYCENCQTTLGWKYEKAFVETQKYKEGKYIIELAHVVRENKHLEVDKGQILFNRAIKQQPKICQDQSYNNSSNNYSLASPSHSPTTSSRAQSPKGDVTCRREVSSSGQRDNKISPSIGDDVDDDLMFVFYDDFSSQNSSYSNSFCSTNHNRYRRSLYLDSTPYDWKYFATDGTTDSTSLSPSSSGHATSSGTSQQETSPYDETQFKFEADKQHTDCPINEAVKCCNEDDNDVAVAKGQLLMKKCDHQQQIHSGINKNTSSNDCSSSEQQQQKGEKRDNSNRDFCAPSNSSKQGNQKYAGGCSLNLCPLLTEDNSPTKSIGDKAITSDDCNDSDDSNLRDENSDVSNGNQSIYLDDEEFYDCYTEHDLT